MKPIKDVIHAPTHAGYARRTGQARQGGVLDTFGCRENELIHPGNGRSAIEHVGKHRAPRQVEHGLAR